MIEVCAEEGVSLEQLFLVFCFFFAVVFIIMAILENNLKNSLWKF